jgi:hypothetical protein
MLQQDASDTEHRMELTAITETAEAGQQPHRSLELRLQAFQMRFG